MNMTQSRAAYSCTALAGTNKAGKLTPDEDGYYTLVLGALDVFNSGGAYYPLETAKHVFEKSSSLMRRIAEGNCKGECGHPKPKSGQNTRDFMGRVMQIEETNICCHFRSVYLETSDEKSPNGRPIVLVMGEVKPSGPRGPALKEALENPHENVCFSVRSLTNDKRSMTGILQKNIKTIITWDWVTEPGISKATKYNNPSLESMAETIVTPEHLCAVEEQAQDRGVSMESGGGVSPFGLAQDLGWDKIMGGRSAMPASMSW